MGIFSFLKKKKKVDVFSLNNPNAGFRQVDPIKDIEQVSNIPKGDAYDLPNVKPLPPDAQVNNFIPKPPTGGGNRHGGGRVETNTPSPNMSIPNQQTPDFKPQPVNNNPNYKPRPNNFVQPINRILKPDEYGGSAVYDPIRRGIVTSDGRFYPTKGGYSGWLPPNYRRGNLGSVTTMFKVNEINPITGEVINTSYSNDTQEYLFEQPIKSNNLNSNQSSVINGVTDNSGGYTNSSSSDLPSDKGIKATIWKGAASWAEIGESGVERWNNYYKRSKLIKAKGLLFGVVASAEVANNIIFQTPNMIVHPLKTLKGGWNLISGTAKDPVGTGKKLVSSAKTNPAVFTGDVASIFVPIPLGKATKLFKNKLISLGKTEIKEGEIFGKITSKSKIEVINKFENTKVANTYQGVHTTSSKFSSFNPKKVKRIEDRGVFISNMGGGNKAWLNLEVGTKAKWSFNPLKNIGNNPNVIMVEFKNLKELPSKVVSKAKSIYKKGGYTRIARAKAYSYVNSWYYRRAKPSTAYIPFRTEIWETPETQVIIPYKFKTRLKREGSILQRLSGYKNYVKVNGVNVPVRKFVTELERGKKSKGIEIGDINKRYKNYSDYEYTRYKTPSSYLSKIRSHRRYSYSNYKSYGKKIVYVQSYNNYPNKIYKIIKKYPIRYKISRASYKYSSKLVPSYLINKSIIYSHKINQNNKKKKFISGIERNVFPELKRKKYVFKTKYQPSFTAIVFKIKGKKPKELIKGYSPFIRPEI